MPCAAKTEVLPKIIDHNAVMLTLGIPQIQEVRAARMVCDYRNAQWERLKEELDAEDWISMKAMSADVAASFLTSKILSLARSWIPQRMIFNIKRSHHG